jgi:DUF971 family protein
MSAPTEIRLRKAEKILEIAFADGARFALPAEYLRVESPSAEVQGHGPGQKVYCGRAAPCRHYRAGTGGPLCASHQL